MDTKFSVTSCFARLFLLYLLATSDLNNLITLAVVFKDMVVSDGYLFGVQLVQLVLKK